MTTRSAAHRPGMTGNKSPPSLRAQRSNPSLSKWRHGLLRFARNDDAQIQNTPPHSRGPIARVLPNRFPPKTEGAGNAGCALHPRSRVQNCAKEPHTSIQVQRKHSGIPRAMALRLMACSPRRRIRLVTVIGGLKVLPSPVGLNKTSADLTPATGARTTRFCRTLQHRSSGARRSLTENRPAITASRPTLPRPPHPTPTFVTMANAPSLRDETAGVIVLICPTL